MSLAPPPSSGPDRAASTLSLELPSNNPFRKSSIPSPAIPSPDSLPPNGRPVSRNPFLADFEQATEPTQKSENAPLIRTMSPPDRSSPVKTSFGKDAKDSFENLSINEKPPIRKPSPQPPSRSGTGPLNTHRSALSNEAGKPTSRGPPRPRRGPRDPFDSPEKSENRRPRRNSDSSITPVKPSGDDDRRRRERKHRESSRAKDGKDGKGTRDPRTGRMRKPGGFDTIDNLDVTGIYGSGLFHHDGPFDACNPHRNRRRDHKAPMEAFPVNSANNVLGPSGPVNKTFNMDQFHGTVPEGFTDYNNTQRPHKAQRGGVFNPVERAEQVHGEETFGLGTSTFLEGAPASRAAIQRRESEAEEKARLAALDPAGGLGRKKSLAQRIRGISAPRRSVYDANGVKISSPEARFSAAVTSPMGQTPGSGPERSKTTGGMKTSEKNPFFNEYDDAYERKGAAIALARGSGEEPRRSSVPAVPAVPKLIPVQDEISVVKPGGEKVASPTKVTANPLERRTTTDGVGAEPEKEKESVEAVQKAREGLMSRMKSLKGVRRKP